MKIKISIFLCITLVLILLLIFNYRYPFITPVGGKWSVGYHQSERIFPDADLNSSRIITYEHIDSIISEAIDYIADPFFIKEKDTFYLFVELKGTKDADIALLTSPDGVNYSYEGIVLDEDFHLSYPQVFKHNGEFYMLPESKGSNQVLLYKADDFPFNWSITDTLLYNRRLVDATILLDKNLNLLVGVDDDMKQYMFTADSLRGKWTEAKNYEQRWGNETRPGGRFFEVDGTYYLPIQDRKYGYGSGISIFRLSTDNNYLKLIREKKEYLGPQEDIKWFNRGMHQLDIQRIGDDYYMVYDGDYNKTGETYFQFKRTLKFIYSDIYNLFQ